MEITRSTIGIKYLKNVKLENGGTIKLIREVGRFKKGKGSQPELSSVKRIFELDNVRISTEKLIQLLFPGGRALHIEKRGEKITKIFSGSGLTKLEVKPLIGWNVPAGFSVLTGEASYQALQMLGLKDYVVEK